MLRKLIQRWQRHRAVRTIAGAALNSGAFTAEQWPLADGVEPALALAREWLNTLIDDFRATPYGAGGYAVTLGLARKDEADSISLWREALSPFARLERSERVDEAIDRLRAAVAAYPDATHIEVYFASIGDILLALLEEAE